MNPKKKDNAIVEKEYNVVIEGMLQDDVLNLHFDSNKIDIPVNTKTIKQSIYNTAYHFYGRIDEVSNKLTPEEMPDGIELEVSTRLETLSIDGVRAIITEGYRVYIRDNEYQDKEYMGWYKNVLESYIPDIIKELKDFK